MKRAFFIITLIFSALFLHNSWEWPFDSSQSEYCHEHGRTNSEHNTQDVLMLTFDAIPCTVSHTEEQMPMAQRTNARQHQSSDFSLKEILKSRNSLCQRQYRQKIRHNFNAKLCADGHYTYRRGILII